MLFYAGDRLKLYPCHFVALLAPNPGDAPLLLGDITELFEYDNCRPSGQQGAFFIHIRQLLKGGRRQYIAGHMVLSRDIGGL